MICLVEREMDDMYKQLRQLERVVYSSISNVLYIEEIVPKYNMICLVMYDVVYTGYLILTLV